MIQRIQTVYMIIVIMLMGGGLFLPLVRFVDGAKEVGCMTNWMFSQNGAVNTWAPCALAVLALIIVVLTLMAVFLFHFRMRQVRLLIFTTILLVGYVALVALGAWKFSLQLGLPLDVQNNVHIGYAVIFPVISIILNSMAIHSIRKDEKLVRSLDRLR